jgi:hypothetical protein
MYIEDLELCRYHVGAFDAKNWSVPLRAVGWLEYPAKYRSGESLNQLIPKLKEMVEQVHSAFRHCCFRGVMTCSWCRANGIQSPGPIWSQESVFVPGDGVVYVAPGGIIHYIERHSYLPPTEFIEAVLRCPDLRSEEYYEALYAANNDKVPPLKSETIFQLEISEMKLESALVRGGE